MRGIWPLHMPQCVDLAGTPFPGPQFLCLLHGHTNPAGVVVSFRQDQGVGGPRRWSQDRLYDLQGPRQKLLSFRLVIAGHYSKHRPSERGAGAAAQVRRPGSWPRGSSVSAVTWLCICSVPFLGLSFSICKPEVGA